MSARFLTDLHMIKLHQALNSKLSLDPSFIIFQAELSFSLAPSLLLSPTSRSLVPIAVTEGGRQGSSPQRWTPSLPHCWELHLSLSLTAGSYTSLSPISAGHRTSASNYTMA